MKLTLEFLKKINAFTKSTRWFETAYGDETEITPEFIKHAEDEDIFCIPWLIGHASLDMVKCLIENGANIRIVNDLALRWSVTSNHLDVVKYLIENGANIHARDDLALLWSVEYCLFDMVKLLVENGANIHAQWDRALQYSIELGNQEITEYLQSIIDKETK